MPAADPADRPVAQASCAAPDGEVRVVDDVAHGFVQCVVDEFGLRAGSAGRFSMVLSGGPTARRCYEGLAAAGGIDWSRVDLFIGDERCVDAADPDANQRLVREALLERVGPVGSFHPMSCVAGPAAYAALVAGAAGFDLVHLGLGPDGHCASLFPGSPDLDAPTSELVVATADPSARNPHRRMSLTLSGIGRGRLVVFTVAGAAKREALGRVLRGEPLPAGRVRAARVLWLVDPDAAGG